MIYEFKCRATGTVVMTQKVAERILAIIGKEPGSQGIILPDRMPDAIRTLEAAVEAEREAERRAKESTKEAAPEDEGEDEGAEKDRTPVVSLGQRAWPFIQMLKDAAAAEREITWGV
ncbi:DUF1840 domain-containing protein [Quisquiliibacterium transsilvanicum]|uniref:Cyclopropane-fatty-acyl-phospholipid synthase n=1 Tax=Quisquiliibacterium transsilvanicum TaxID=1549638 RepID=A0A7W8M9B6_9BURK|nr:DUF1840 domain-containing protein [Quisquiliibacterium transsilvanicum]MBB5272861.1 cyclopropane-fatty-acyl-phospholipid synthase [Quisquiliibacterium transsilvanicum]